MSRDYGDPHHLIFYYDENANGKEFGCCPDVIREVTIIIFTPVDRKVTIEKRATDVLDRSTLAKKGKPTNDELLNTGRMVSRNEYTIPRPPINPSTLICKCGKYTQISISHSTENPDRLYAQCSTSTCKYFQWCNTAHIVCKCDKSALYIGDDLKKKSKKANKKPPCYMCKNYKNKTGPRCDYFRWESDIIFAGYLGSDWGDRFMSVEDALYKFSQHTERTLRDSPVDRKVLSTLAAECTSVAAYP